jgi:hypothetical protein
VTHPVRDAVDTIESVLQEVLSGPTQSFRLGLNGQSEMPRSVRIARGLEGRESRPEPEKIGWSYEENINYSIRQTASGVSPSALDRPLCRF